MKLKTTPAIRKYMSELSKKRWKKTTKKERVAFGNMLVAARNKPEERQFPHQMEHIGPVDK